MKQLTKKSSIYERVQVWFEYYLKKGFSPEVAVKKAAKVDIDKNPHPKGFNRL